MKRDLSSLNAGKVYLAVILVNVAIQFLASVIALVAPITNGSQEFKTFNLIFMAVLQLGNVAVLYFYGKKGFCVCDTVRRVKWWAYPLCVAIAGICVYFFIWPTNLFALWLENIGYNFSEALTFDTPFSIIFGGIVVCFVAPVIEELVFRGAILSGLEKRFGPVVSVLLCGFAFSLMHMNPEQTVYQFFLGCVCAFLTLRSRSVLPAMTVHSASNVIAFALSFFPTSEVSGDVTTLVLLSVLFTAIGVVAVYFLGKIITKAQTAKCEESKTDGEEDVSKEEGSKKNILVPYSVAAVVCLSMWISVFVSAVFVVV